MICSVRSCDRGAVAKGFCKRHWHKNHRYGDPEGGASYQQGEGLEWLSSHVGWKGDECLAWPFGKSKDGYGVVIVDGRQVKASRAMCAAAHGEAPTSRHFAAHSCGKGHEACVNPKHLRWATPAENQQDRVLHGTDGRGERGGMAILKEADVREIRRRAEAGEQVASIANDYPVTMSAVWSVVKGRTWAWLNERKTP